MTMTNEEICRAYRLAKNKANEVGVLADLNDCDRKEILAILEEGGEKVDQRLYGRKKKKEEKPMPEKMNTASVPAPVAAPIPAPKKTGVTLSKADATLLSEFMEAAVCQHVVNHLATDEPRECLLQLHKLTGLYKRLVEVLE